MKEKSYSFGTVVVRLAILVGLLYLMVAGLNWHASNQPSLRSAPTPPTTQQQTQVQSSKQTKPLWQRFNALPNDPNLRFDWMVKHHPEPLVSVDLREWFASRQLSLRGMKDRRDVDATFSVAPLSPGGPAVPVLLLQSRMTANKRNREHFVYDMSVLFHEAVHVEQYFQTENWDVADWSEDEKCRVLLQREEPAYRRQCYFLKKFGVRKSHDCEKMGVNYLRSRIARALDETTKMCQPHFKRFLRELDE